MPPKFLNLFLLTADVTKLNHDLCWVSNLIWRCCWVQHNLQVFLQGSSSVDNNNKPPWQQRNYIVKGLNLVVKQQLRLQKGVGLCVCVCVCAHMCMLGVLGGGEHLQLVVPSCPPLTLFPSISFFSFLFSFLLQDLFPHSLVHSVHVCVCVWRERESIGQWW